MVDTEGVSAEGGVGVLVFEGLGLLVPAALLFLLVGDRWLEGLVIQVPGGGWQVPVKGWTLERVVAACVVR